MEGMLATVQWDARHNGKQKRLGACQLTGAQPSPPGRQLELF